MDMALKLREDIRNTPIRDTTDVEHMDELNTEAQQTLTRVKLLADLFIGEVLSFTGNSKKLQERLDTLSVVVDDVFVNDKEANRKYRIEARKKLDLDLPLGKPHRRPFHWALEFPEVFQSGGFDAICGNPPFQRRTAFDRLAWNGLSGLSGESGLPMEQKVRRTWSPVFI